MSVSAGVKGKIRQLYFCGRTGISCPHSADMSASIDHEPYLRVLAERLATASREVQNCATTIAASSSNGSHPTTSPSSDARVGLLMLACSELEEARLVFSTFTLSVWKHQREHAVSDAKLARQQLEQSEQYNHELRIRFDAILNELRAGAKKEADGLTEMLTTARASTEKLENLCKADAAAALDAAEAAEKRHALAQTKLDEQHVTERAHTREATQRQLTSLREDSSAMHHVYKREVESMEALIGALMEANTNLERENGRRAEELVLLREDKDAVIRGLCDEIARLKTTMQLAITPSGGRTSGPPSAWRKMNLESLKKVSRPLLRAEASILLAPSSARVAPGGRREGLEGCKGLPGS